MTDREVSSERVSEERLGQIATDKDNFYRPEIKAMAQEILALRSSVKTVGVKSDSQSNSESVE